MSSTDPVFSTVPWTEVLDWIKTKGEGHLSASVHLSLLPDSCCNVGQPPHVSDFPAQVDHILK